MAHADKHVQPFGYTVNESWSAVVFSKLLFYDDDEINLTQTNKKEFLGRKCINSRVWMNRKEQAAIHLLIWYVLWGFSSLIAHFN